MEYRITTLTKYLIQFNITDAEGKEHLVHSSKKGNVFHTYNLNDRLLCLAKTKEIKIAEQNNKKVKDILEEKAFVENKEKELAAEEKIIQEVTEDKQPSNGARRRTRKRNL